MARFELAVSVFQGRRGLRTPPHLVNRRDSRCRTCRLLVPNQASHPKTISRLKNKHPIELFHQDIHWPAHHSLLITLTHFLRCCATPGVFAERGGIEPHPRKWTSRLAGGTNHRHSSLSILARQQGFEPRTSVLETGMIPFHH